MRLQVLTLMRSLETALSGVNPNPVTTTKRVRCVHRHPLENSYNHCETRNASLRRGTNGITRLGFDKTYGETIGRDES